MTYTRPDEAHTKSGFSMHEAPATELAAVLRDVLSWFPGRATWHTDAPVQAAERAYAALARYDTGARP